MTSNTDTAPSRFRSPATLAAVALAVGLVVGLIAQRAGFADPLVALLEPIGTLWVNAIRMTVIPLVFSLLITTIVSAGDAGTVGRLSVRSVVWFVVLLAVIAIAVAFIAPVIYAGLVIDPASAASLRQSASVTTPDIPGFSAWLIGLVPPNPVKAASDGAMLPLILFAVLFALALTKIEPAVRQGTTDFFRAIADAMIVLVQWLLLLAPIGVFALAVVLAARIGVGVAGAVGFYLLVHSGLLAVSTALLYVVAVTVGRVSPGRFARALVPAQVVAFSTRSSVAALPAMLQGARETLGIPDSVAGFVLPFGVSVFRLNQAVSWVVCALFVGKLYGVELDAPTIALLAALSVPMSFSVPGIPSGGLFVLAPFYVSVGLPIEGVGILIALDAIPDVFKTLLNVTGHMTATVLVARDARAEAGQPLDVLQAGA